MATDYEFQHEPIGAIRDGARGRTAAIGHVRLAAGSVLFGLSIAVGACGSNGLGPSPLPPPPPPPPNSAPVIRSIEAGQPRLEVGASTTFTAVVEDAETPSDRLQYQWTAEAGTFSGEGARVTWQAPASLAAPINPAVTLTVVETYVVNGLQQSNRSSLLTSAVVRVHDSRAELAELADSFLDDFEDSAVTPERCVRNFSIATCSQGRRSELEDIEFNRSNYDMLTSSRHSAASVTINEPWARAEMRSSCTFVSRIKATGQTGTASGTCRLTAVYEQDRWWLCTSSFTGASTNSLFFIR
jgi:hypothetical protein